jgi:outer membrane murein-binding lipoprotein Lpp
LIIKITEQIDEIQENTPKPPKPTKDIGVSQKTKATTLSLEKLQSQKDALEKEFADLENEIKELEAAESDANTLNAELDKADTKTEELTADVIILLEENIDRRLLLPKSNNL